MGEVIRGKEIALYTLIEILGNRKSHTLSSDVDWAFCNFAALTTMFAIRIEISRSFSDATFRAVLFNRDSLAISYSEMFSRKYS